MYLTWEMFQLGLLDLHPITSPGSYSVDYSELIKYEPIQVQVHKLLGRVLCHKRNQLKWHDFNTHCFHWLHNTIHSLACCIKETEIYYTICKQTSFRACMIKWELVLWWITNYSWIHGATVTRLADAKLVGCPPPLLLARILPVHFCISY